MLRYTLFKSSYTKESTLYLSGLEHKKHKYVAHIVLVGRSLAEVAKFSLKDLKPWMERETKSLFTPIHAKVQKLADEMRKWLDNLVEISKTLLDNSQKEIEKRNMRTYGRARAMNKLSRMFLERLRQTKIPEKITYDSFNDFVQETQKVFLAIDVDVRNWFPRISPFFILDRRKFQVIFEKTKEILKEQSSFLTKEYVKVKTLEQTFQLIDRVQNLEQQLAILKERKSETENEKTQLEGSISRIQEKMASMKTQGSLGELFQMNSEVEGLSAEVKQNLQHLQKPFVKLQSLATHGEGSGLTPDELNKLNHYIDDPFIAFACDETGYPSLKQVLRKLDVAMKEGKLKLKPEKTRKAEQVIDSILKANSLSNLHEKSMKVVDRRTHLSISPEVADTERELSKLKEELDTSERRRRMIEGEISSMGRTCDETSDRIKFHKTEIEKNANDFMNRRIHVE